MRLFAAVALILLVFATSGRGAAQDEGKVGAAVFVDPLAATLRLRPERVQLRHQATARATIVNAGPEPTGAVTATLLVDPGGVTIIDGGTKTLSGIAGRTSQTVEWRLCGARRGSYLAMAVITSRDAAGHVFRAETTAVLLEVGANKGSSRDVDAC